MGDSNTCVPYAESKALPTAPWNIVVVTPGRDITHDFLTSCIGTLKTIAFTIHKTLDQIDKLVLGRKRYDYSLRLCPVNQGRFCRGRLFLIILFAQFLFTQVDLNFYNVDL